MSLTAFSEPVQRVLDRLDALGKTVRWINDQHLAQCPAHEDRTPSLAVRDGDAGAVLTCHAGCSTEAVCKALGMSTAELFTVFYHRRNGKGPTVAHSSSDTSLSWVADYVYHDAGGAPAFKVARFAQLDAAGAPVGKSFRQYRRDLAGAWSAGLNGAIPPLYRLPEVLVAVAAGQLVLVVEGEKDADAGVAAGLCATSAPMGAGKWRPEHTEALRDARVIIVADDDPPGRAHAVAVYTALEPVAASVAITLPAAGCKDLAEHLAGGHGTGALRPVTPDALAGPPADAEGIVSQVASPLDRLRAQLVDSRGLEDIPEPRSLVDGMLFLDSLAWLQGRPGNGKSFVALDIAASVGTEETWQGRLTTHGTVLYLIAEGLSGLKMRVRAWEASTNVVMEHVQFLPVAVQVAHDAEWTAFIDLAVELDPALVVIDTQARVTVGMEENSAMDMGIFVQRVERLRVATGGCVLVVHHQGRSGEHMRGSTALEGAATTVIRVTKTEDLVDVECAKQKDAPEFDPFSLRLIPYDSSAILSLIDLDAKINLGQPAVLRMLSSWWDQHETDWMSVTTLVDSGICTKPTFHRVKKTLEKAHLIESSGDGIQRRYRLSRKPAVS